MDGVGECGLSKRRRLKTPKEWLYRGVWICDGVADSRKRVSRVSFSIAVKLWRVRAIVEGERSREMEVGYGI